MKKTKSLILSIVFLLLLISVLAASYILPQKPKNHFPFYLYSSFGAHNKTNFHPSGRMGDVNTLRIAGYCKKQPYSGKSCIKLSYDISDAKQIENNWAGVYWLEPPNNWGVMPDTGFDLTGAKKLVFHARGEKGGEVVTFQVGGIQGEYGDTTFVCLPSIEITNEWTKYEIDLEDKKLSRIIGGFCCVFNKSYNPRGAVIYLDEIYYE
ncbi:MAG: hypothetical protein KAI43_07485 [Candidatus Aureabacteria bacterium]|nr:hypothetical protein [Candidatus Auribacterota bacterium]